MITDFDLRPRVVAAASFLYHSPRNMVAIALGALLCALIAPAQAEADSGTVVDAEANTVTRLEPGDNFIGWIGPPTTFRDLFAALPDIVVAFTWDANLQQFRMASPKLSERYWSMRALKPNAAYLIRVAGASPVEWERTVAPHRGLVELRSGVNWLSWAGPSDWPVTDVARGIGRSLVSITLGNHEYRPDQPDSAATLPLVQRGDALIVTVSRDIQWLQPAGIAPQLVFLGNVSARVRRQAHDDLQSMMDFFLTEFGIQPDGSAFSILIADTFQSLLEHKEATSGKLDEANISELRRLWNGALGWAGEDVVVVEKSFSCARCAGRYTLTHEVFHKLQEQLRNGGSLEPAWMLEGTANWAHSTHGMLDRHRLYTAVLRELRQRAAQGPVLESAEGQHRAWAYSLGHLATLSLVEAAGIDGPIEFYRLLAPTGTGAGNRWPSLSPWRDAFVSAFGVTVDDFYSSFGETQESLPGRTGVRRQANERVLRGTIGRADDSPVGPVWVTANQVNSQGHVSLVQRSLSDETGSFELFVPHSANYRIGIELVSDYWCHVWHTDGGITNTPIAASLVRVSTRSVTNVKVVIPDQVCAQRIVGQVFGPDGDPLGGIPVRVTGAGNEQSAWFIGITKPDGTFIVDIPDPGRYHVSVDLGGCWVFYQHDGVVFNSDRATSLSVLEGSASGLRIEIPTQVCEIQISGEVVGADDAPLNDVEVLAFSDQYTATATTDDEGEFTITVPRQDSYRLQAFVGSCHVFYSPNGVTTRFADTYEFSVNGRDKWGFDIRLREGMCEHIIDGVLQDADGRGVSNSWLVAFSGEAEAATFTESDGSFSLRVPIDGRYRLRTNVDGCNLYRRFRGATANIVEATTVRVSGSDTTGVIFRLPANISGPCK